MENNTLIIISLIISIIIVIRNFYGAYLSEKDIRKGIDPRMAAKYHRKLFHRKKDKDLYESELSGLNSREFGNSKHFCEETETKEEEIENAEDNSNESMSEM